VGGISVCGDAGGIGRRGVARENRGQRNATPLPALYQRVAVRTFFGIVAAYRVAGVFAIRAAHMPHRALLHLITTRIIVRG
jgi:hypothetical protein